MPELENIKSITNPSLSTEQIIGILESEYGYHQALENWETESTAVLLNIKIKEADVEKKLTKKWPIVLIILAALFAALAIAAGFSLSDTPVWREGDPYPSSWNVFDMLSAMFLVSLFGPLTELGSIISGNPVVTELDFTVLFIFSCVLGLVPLAAFIIFAVLRKMRFKAKYSTLESEQATATENVRKKFIEAGLQQHQERMPKGYDNTFAITQLYYIIKNGRAYTWKDAVNTYEHDMQQTRLLNQQQEFINELYRSQSIAQQALEGWKAESQRSIYVYR